MEQTECIILKSEYPVGNFFKFERAFYEQLKEIADKRKVFFTYVADTYPAYFEVTLKCGVDHAAGFVSATREALQELNRASSRDDLSVQAKYILKEGELTLNGVKKPLKVPMPNHVLFDGMAVAQHGR